MTESDPRRHGRKTTLPGEPKAPPLLPFWRPPPSSICVHSSGLIEIRNGEFLAPLISIGALVEAIEAVVSTRAGRIASMLSRSNVISIVFEDYDMLDLNAAITRLAHYESGAAVSGLRVVEGLEPRAPNETAHPCRSAQDRIDIARHPDLIKLEMDRASGRSSTIPAHHGAAYRIRLFESLLNSGDLALVSQAVERGLRGCPEPRSQREMTAISDAKRYLVSQAYHFWIDRGNPPSREVVEACIALAIDELHHLPEWAEKHLPLAAIDSFQLKAEMDFASGRVDDCPQHRGAVDRATFFRQSLQETGAQQRVDDSFAKAVSEDPELRCLPFSAVIADAKMSAVSQAYRMWFDMGAPMNASIVAQAVQDALVFLDRSASSWPSADLPHFSRPTLGGKSS